MKITVVSSLVLAVFSLLFPFFVSLSSPAPEPAAPPSVSAAPSPYRPSPSPSPEAERQLDAETSVRVLIDGAAETLAMGDYLINVVAAEMPASFEPEALRAQAVAARTYTLYRMHCSPSANHPEADVCTSPGCCKAYKPDAALRELWGDDYSVNLAKITDAVYSTDGLCLVYGGEPILAAFHSSSAGETASSAEVWGGELPYLVSVDSPEDGGETPNYTASITVPFDEFKSAVLSLRPEAELGGDPSGWLGERTLTASGRLESITIGGAAVSGIELRGLFSLRSACIEAETGEDGIVLTTTGYGHGVGMSQYGANVMAADGALFADILDHYYPGSRLASIKDLSAAA